MIMLYWREMLAFYALDLVVLGMKAPGLLGGSFSGQPEEMEAHLGPVAQDLIKRAFVDMYVLKRTLRDPQTGRRLPAGIFTANPA